MTEQRIWNDWPACPQCGRPRQTVCPTCGGAGNQFPLADYQGVGEPQRRSRELEQQRELDSHVESRESRLEESAPSDLATSQPMCRELLLCPRCDEVFKPQFYRICPACGDDAGEGMEDAYQVHEQVGSRVLLAVYGLVAIAVLLLTYFWLLFRDP